MGCGTGCQGFGKEIGRGGRYDGIGRGFGRARPATGFSADLKILMRAGSAGKRYRDRTPKVLAPWSREPALQQRLAAVDVVEPRFAIFFPFKTIGITDE